MRFCSEDSSFSPILGDDRFRDELDDERTDTTFVFRAFFVFDTVWILMLNVNE